MSYPQNPVRSVAELKELLAVMRAALPNVSVPVFLLHSRDDKYILPEHMERIYAALVNAPERTKLYIAGSGHIVTRDAARQQVFDSVFELIQRVGGSI